MSNEKLFVYAELEAIEGGKPASARGILRRRPGGDGAAQFGVGYDYEVHGDLCEVSSEDLESLDRTEAPEYKRQRIMMLDGTFAWAYACVTADFDHYKQIYSGIWTAKPVSTSSAF